MRALVWGLVLLLTACVPVAMLRPPEPARGLEVSVGGSLFNNPFANRNQYPIMPLPYLAVAFGDGELEYNFSVQWGLRGGVKLGLGPGLALDAGLTLLPLDWSQWPPVDLDGGVILGGEGFYFSPRVHLIPRVYISWDYFIPTKVYIDWDTWYLAWQASLGTYRQDWAAEIGILTRTLGFEGSGVDGGSRIYLSAAWRFGIAP
jgi:hypothetical protein